MVHLKNWCTLHRCLEKQVQDDLVENLHNQVYTARQVEVVVETLTKRVGMGNILQQQPRQDQRSVGPYLAVVTFQDLLLVGMVRQGTDMA